LASSAGSFFSELKRRNVYRVGIAYLIASWLLLQVIDVVDPIIGIPEWVPKLILVILAVGLPLALIFAWAYEMTPEGLKRERDVDRTQSITQQTGQRLNRMIIGVLVIAVGILLIDRYVSQQPGGDAIQPLAESATPSTASDEIISTGTPSIAVLPFANMSADESSTYFSDGLADTLLHMLAQIREIRVAARTSSFQFRGQNTDITKIAEALNVGTILEGSVQRAGNKIRVTAQLIEAESGYHLWSGNFDRNLDDVFAIQDEIANEVVAALKVSLLGESAKKLALHDTESIEAYTEFLLGVNDAEEYSFESLPRASERFLNAIRIDPDYAEAHARLADTYLKILDIGAGSREEMLRKAMDAAAKAMALNEHSSLAINTLGTVEKERGKNELAEQLYQRAIAAGPNDVAARISYATLLSELGRRSEYEALMAEVLTLDPMSTSAHDQMTLHHQSTGDFDIAREHVAKIKDINPASPLGYYRSAMLEFTNGNWAKAILELESTLDIDPDDPELAFLIGNYYLVLDMPGEAEQWFDRATEIDAQHPVSLAGPLSLGLYADTLQPDTVKLARQLLQDGIENRWGSRSIAMAVLWIDAVAKGTEEELLGFLGEYLPQFFEDDPNWDITGDAAAITIAALMLECGQEENGNLLLDRVRSRWDTVEQNFGTGLMNVVLAAISGDRQLVAEKAGKFRERGSFAYRWATRYEHLPVFTGLRDMPEIQALDVVYQRHAAEQRQELQRLLGVDTKKRGPI
jgi:TolB-like protein/Tfp pilus assembly protein PilF